MRIVFITQRVDPAHPALAATGPKVAALAALSSEVVVLALGAEQSALPANARARLFAGPNKASRGIRFETALAIELARKPRPAAVVAHMCPIYAVLAAPLARAFGVPVLLWHAHWYGGPMLRAAERVSSAVLTVDRRTFPIPSKKVRSIGHGIDVSEFPRRERESHGGVRALALGRYSPAKGYDTILRGLRLALDAGLDVSLEMHGPVLSRLEAEHRARVKEAVLELGLEERVLVNGSVPRSAVPALFSEYDLLVNNMRKGSPDKVVFEAAASCLPVLASNPAFDGFLDDQYRFPRSDAGALAERFAEFMALDETGRTEVGRELRRRVVEGHSVEHWAEQVLAVAGKR